MSESRSGDKNLGSSAVNFTNLDQGLLLIFQIEFVVAGGGFLSYFNHQLLKLDKIKDSP